MTQEIKYQIKTKSGLYVGLVNFGRTYKACKTSQGLTGITLDEAKQLARQFDGELYEYTYSPCIMSWYGNGWERECWCDDREDAKRTLQDYRDNDPQHAHQIKWKWAERYISLKAA